MATKKYASLTHRDGGELKVKRLTLEQAEESLISDLKTRTKRLHSKQLAAMNRGKVGRPFIFSRDVVLLAAILLYLRCLSYRRLCTELYLIAEIRASKSMLHERIVALEIDIDVKGFLEKRILDCSTDATGFKPTNKGLWRVILHEDGKVRQKNGYAKLAIINDTKTLSILSAQIGDAQTADITLFKPSLEQARSRHRINVLYGDGAYDAYEVYSNCQQAKIVPVMKPRSYSVVHYDRRTMLPRDLRSRYVSFIKNFGYEKWSKRVEYGRRWTSEIVFSKFKRLFGEIVKSKKEENTPKEFTAKVWIYNMLVALQHGFAGSCQLLAICRTAYCILPLAKCFILIFP